MQQATGMSRQAFQAAMAAKRTRTLVEAHIHHRCNQACKHCFMIEQEARDNSRPVTFEQIQTVFENLNQAKYDPYPFPKESSLQPSLYPLYRRFGQTNIHTNAALLSRRPELLEQMWQNGLRSITSSLHGTLRAHCELTQVSEQWYRYTVEGLRAIKARRFRLEVITALYQGNKHELSDLAKLLCELGVDRWCILRILPTGMARQWPLEKFLFGEQCLDVVYQFAELRAKYRPDQLSIEFHISFGPNFYSRGHLRYLAGLRAEWPETKFACPALTRDYLALSMESRKIYPCFHMQSFPETAIGRLQEGNIVLEEDHWWNEESLRHGLQGSCAKDSCEYHDFCLGGCRAAAYSFGAKLGLKDPFLAPIDFCLTKILDQAAARLGPAFSCTA